MFPIFKGSCFQELEHTCIVHYWEIIQVPWESVQNIHILSYLPISLYPSINIVMSSIMFTDQSVSGLGPIGTGFKTLFVFSLFHYTFSHHTMQLTTQIAFISSNLASHTTPRWGGGRLLGVSLRDHCTFTWKK